MLRAAASERHRLQDPSRGGVDVRTSTVPPQSSVQPLNLFPAMVSWPYGGAVQLVHLLPALVSWRYVKLHSRSELTVRGALKHSKSCCS